MRNLRKLAHSFQRPTTKFGDIVTADHVSFAEEGGIYGLNGKVIALVLKDIYSGFLGAYPSDSKNSDEVYIAIQHFLGNVKVRTFYSDNAREIIKAV